MASSRYHMLLLAVNVLALVAAVVKLASSAQPAPAALPCIAAEVTSPITTPVWRRHTFSELVTSPTRDRRHDHQTAGSLRSDDSPPLKM